MVQARDAWLKSQLKGDESCIWSQMAWRALGVRMEQQIVQDHKDLPFILKWEQKAQKVFELSRQVCTEMKQGSN